VPYPPKLLNANERVLLDLRPHWIRLVFPTTVLLVVIAGNIAGLVLWSNAPSAFGYALAALVFITLCYAVGQFIAWRTTNLVLTSSRVVYREGVVHRIGREIPLDRVQDATYHQKLLERLVGAGSLVVESGGDRGAEPFPDIRDPENVQRQLNQAIDDLRRAPLVVPTEQNPVIGQIEELAELHRRGVITDTEFGEKKAELLGRL
jgi:uncharacterized membrane protein YdbT with pleckstrin-like domain